MIKLTKEQSLLAHYKNNLLLQNKNRFSFNSKTPAKCLKCLKPIYISYFESNVKSVFCNDHKNYANEKNIAQLQYLRIIKEQQIKTVC